MLRNIRNNAEYYAGNALVVIGVTALVGIGAMCFIAAFAPHLFVG